MESLINIDDFKKKTKKRFIINVVLISLLLIVSIGVSVTLLLISKVEYTWYMVISIILTVSGALFALFYFLNIFPIVRHYYFFYKNMNPVSLDNRRHMVYLKEIEGREIDNVKYRVVQFNYREGENTFTDNLYILDNDVKFMIGRAYKLNTYHNVIVNYEVIK